MTRRTARTRGVTFLEIVFAVAILAVAMLPILQTSQMGIRRTGFNIHRITATMLSNQLMERYRTMPFAWLQNKFAGGLDMEESLNTDPILASPLLPQSYKTLLKKYKVEGKFEDISGDEGLGLLSFTVEWKASEKAAKSKLSLGKAIINYAKFGITTVNTQGGFLQAAGTSVTNLNTDWDSPAPTTPGATGSPSGTTGASPTTVVPTNPFDAINSYG